MTKANYHEVSKTDKFKTVFGATFLVSHSQHNKWIKDRDDAEILTLLDNAMSNLELEDVTFKKLREAEKLIGEAFARISAWRSEND